MTPKGLGQYDMEYDSHPCFWGKNPGKYVTLLTTMLHKGHVLDLGAGEGKNSIYLAKKGFNVVAVECSDSGLENFRRRLHDVPSGSRKHIKIVKDDVRDFQPNITFDAIIAYGLLHCLPNESDAMTVVRRMKAWTKPNGYNVVVTFTPKLPVPKQQQYLQATFLPPNELVSWYDDWLVKRLEEEIITEAHPTSGTKHKHAICRLLSQNR